MNRVALDLGIIQIYWYSICILVGMMIGMFLVYKETLRKNIGENLITNLIFYTIIVAIIGARLYYVAFDWGYYSKNPVEIFEIWNGGLAIHGAIILGGLFVISYTKQHKMDTLKVLDICAVGLIIGQAIGRWGNFFNQEVYGKVVSLEYLKGFHLPDFIIDGMKIAGEYHQPLFLYESIWCIIGFIVLLIIRRRKYIKTGQIFGIYCMWYSVGRFFLEGMRDEKYNLMLGNMKVAQIISIGMFVVGLFFFVRRIRTSRFEYLYNDEGIQIETTDNDPAKKSFYDKKDNKKKMSFIPTHSSVSTNAVPATVPEAPTEKKEEPAAPTLSLQPTQQVPVQPVQPTPADPVNTPTIEELTKEQQSSGPILNNQVFSGQTQSTQPAESVQPAASTQPSTTNNTFIQ